MKKGEVVLEGSFVMYESYFGLSAAPFSIAPDPRYLYLSKRHNEARAHLVYGLESQCGGFVLLTGEIGAGKTTICRSVLERLPPDCDVALVVNPRLDMVEMLQTVCDELGIEYPPGTNTVKPFFERINRRLLDGHARGRKTILIIDEAQNLSDEVLEQLRLLTNLETSERKLMQIILLGQPELQDRLAMPHLKQLSQRIIARYHLENLSANDVVAYVRHRLLVAGCERPLLPHAVVTRIYKKTGGNPRLINVVCDRALLGAYVQGLPHVDLPTAERAIEEVFGAPTGFWKRWSRFWRRHVGGAAAAAMVVAVIAQGATSVGATSAGGSQAPGLVDAQTPHIRTGG